MNASSIPWNVAPETSNSETASPWAVPPIQKSNLFASRDTASESAELSSEVSIDELLMKEGLPVEILPTEKLPILSAFSSAFEPKVEMAGEVIASSETGLGLHAGHFSQTSAWTTNAIEKVQVQETAELTVNDKLAQQIPGFVPAENTAVTEDKAVEKSLLMGVQPPVEKNNMRYMQAETSESAWTKHVDRGASRSAIENAKVANNFLSKKVPSGEVADILDGQSIAEVTPLEELKRPFDEASADLTAIKSISREDAIKATSDIWNTPLVQKASMQEESAVDEGEEEEAIKKAAEEIKGRLFDASMKAFSAVEEVEAAFCKDMTNSSTEDGAGPWTTPPMQGEESNAAFSLTVSAQNVEESAPVVANILEITEAPTNRDKAVEWITNKEAEGPIEKLIFDGNLSPVRKTPIFEDSEFEKMPNAFLNRNAVPDQKIVKAIVTPVQEVVVERMKEDVAEPVQEPIIFNQTRQNFKNAMLLTQKNSEAETHEVEKASVGSESAERKATAEALDCYVANSIVKVDKLSGVKAITANSTNAPEFCGISSCSIM